MNRIKNNRGMTIIELLIVLTLMVCITCLATAAFVNFFRAKDPELFMKDMKSYVRYLQFKTIEDGKIYKLSLEPDRGTLITSRQENGKQFSAVRDSLSKRFEIEGPFKARMEEGQEIYFFPDGTLTQNKISIFHEDHKIATLSLGHRLGASKVEFYG